jgi:hypothetical protein
MMSSSKTVAALEDRVRNGRVFYAPGAIHFPEPRAPVVIDGPTELTILRYVPYSIRVEPVVIGFGNIE